MNINPNAVFLIFFTTLIGLSVSYFNGWALFGGALIGATLGSSVVMGFTLIRSR